jgi:LIM domain-containing protein 2
VACRYIVKDDNPHCIPCYQELYAHNCEECKKPIGPDYKVCFCMHVEASI